MTDPPPSLEDRVLSLEKRLHSLEEVMSSIVSGLNEAPKRSLRHPFASINHLATEVSKVNEDYQHLIAEIRRPAHPG